MIESKKRYVYCVYIKIGDKTSLIYYDAIFVKFLHLSS